ncbi:MAG: 3-methyl-2-oxobutanoate hydroxymethyltransferase, partial [Candidatus Krumholzibacteriia bacterium]
MNKARTLMLFARARRRGEKIVMVTAYDLTSALIAARGGADALLVGDSLGMVVLGHENTLPVTVDDMVHHCRAVQRARTGVPVIADLPYGSFHVSPAATVAAALRLVKEGGVSAVKLEGGRKRAEVVAALLAAEIPVMGHLGLTPQSVHAFGGYKVQGRGQGPAGAMMEDARFLADAGCFALVLECVPRELAARITEAVPIPTIGIGAGPACDGQVLVFHDLLGLLPGTTPRFVRRYAELGAQPPRPPLPVP